jgi:branched-chain amino acid transport system substrate-binding protein
MTVEGADSPSRTATWCWIEDKDAFRSALRHVQFPAIRGPFKFDTNQYPIQNIYLTKVVKDPDGGMRLALKATALES